MLTAVTDATTPDPSSEPVDMTNVLDTLSQMRGESLAECLDSMKAFRNGLQEEELPPLIQEVAPWTEVEPVIARLPSLTAIRQVPIVREYVAISIQWPGTIYVIGAEPTDRGFFVVGVYAWPGEDPPARRIQPFYVGDWNGSAFLVTFADYDRVTDYADRDLLVETLPFTIVSAIWSTEGVIRRWPRAVPRNGIGEQRLSGDRTPRARHLVSSRRAT